MKPTLLYVFRDPLDWQSHDVQREYMERDSAIVEALSDKFFISTKKNILTLEPLYARKFEYIVTHLQDDPDIEEFRYMQSLLIIGQICDRNPQIKIVVYTGASARAISDEKLKEAGAKAVIRKKNIRRLQEDVSEVKTCLERLLNEQP